MWLLPPASFLSSPASAASTSASPPPFQDAARSATWRGKPFALRSWRAAWRTAPWLRLLSGLTSAPSTPVPGAVASTPSPQAGHALPSPSPEKEKVGTMTAGFGPRSSECFAIVEPDGSFSKTYGGFSQATIFGKSERFSETFPVSGALRNGRLYRRPMLARRTGGSGSSYWPTATAHDGHRPSADEHSTQGANLSRDTACWPTPGANDHKGTAREGQRRGQLDEAAEQHWTTPHGPSLNELWQTPATDSFRSRRNHEMGLDREARLWPTPDVSVTTTSNRSCSPNAADRPALAKAARIHSLPDPATSTPGPASSPSAQTSPPPSPPKRRLNYRFVAWLMGFPEGWLDLHAPTPSAPSATPSCRRRPRSRSANSGGGS